MRVVTTAADIGPRYAGHSRAVVMTMGALHEGHLSLVRTARAAADEVVVSIFVNPLQFDQPEDLARYPRTLDEDVAMLEAEGVDVVFAPLASDMYPQGDPIVRVSAGRIGQVFEGAHRPGHFDGVLTVVIKMLHMTRPDLAIFGQKDAQQLIAIKAMVRDLDVRSEIVGSPTARDADGLALSSRNRFLSEADHANALSLSGALLAAVSRAEAGDGVGEVLAAGYAVLADAPEVHLDYFAALDPKTSEAVSSGYVGDVIIAVAARVGETRLIDNMAAKIKGNPS